jgi:hypothetical protein
MGNPFLFADRFSGAVVHLTTGRLIDLAPLRNNRYYRDQLSNAWPRKQKMPAAVWLTQAFHD